MPLLPNDDPLAKYVDKVGQRVATTSDRPELFYRFHVVDDGTINAFALPGGYIYVHRGLLAHFNSEAELAAVLGATTASITMPPFWFETGVVEPEELLAQTASYFENK